MQEVVIVVPIYKTEHSIYEKISISQLFAVLGKYPIVFIAPISLDIEKVDLINQIVSVEYFDDAFFKSTEDYSRLCLSSIFYERFIDYEYMLIYQTDAFVFSDKLHEFIAMNYDYIGAPLKNEFWTDYHVGNGGLSLRKIANTINVVKKYDDIVKVNPYAINFTKFEDNFFGFCGYCQDIDYYVPPIEIAASFSVQDDSCGAYRIIKNEGLPLGVHKWKEENYKFWKPYIESYGYVLPEEVVSANMLECDRRKRFLRFIPIFFDTLGKSEKNRFLIPCSMDINKKYSIWGAGKIGHKCLEILKSIGVEIECFIDNNKLLSGKEINQIPVVHPSEYDFETRSEVIIAVENGKDEILKQISLISKRRKFIIFSEMIDLMDVYIKNNGPQIEGITIPFKIVDLSVNQNI